MRIHYTLDDSAARLPLALRSSDALHDRLAELRSAAGVHLVELATQYVLNTGAMLADELEHYFETGTPSEADPYALARCYANRAQLEDQLEDLKEVQPGLVALHQVAEFFPITFTHDLQFMLALTAVGYPAFGYIRTYKDSEDDVYHGMVVNLAQARPHLESTVGSYSLDLLVNIIRHGFFNHEGFLLAYAEYCEITGRAFEKPLDRLKDALLSRGIAWYLSYRHDYALYDEILGLNDGRLPGLVDHCNAMLTAARKKKPFDEPLDQGPSHREQALDVVGYYAARSIAEVHGDNGLRASIVEGPDHYLELYNALGRFPLRAGARR